MNLEGDICRLRAVEPEDAELLYGWENDPAVWHVSGTTAPYSREWMRRFVEQQQFDVWQTRQLRLMIESRAGGDSSESVAPVPVGALDLFEFDPQHRRAGVGILIYDPQQRRRGYAGDALTVVERYASEVLGLHQLWCEVEVDNTPSVALFRGAGFETCGVRREWLWTPQGYRDVVLMQKIFMHSSRC